MTMSSLVTRNFEDYNCYFVVKYGNAVFAEGTVVKRDIVMNNSILVCDINDRLLNEWLMDYDLYPVNPRNVGGMKWPFFEEKYHKIAEDFMSEN